MINTKSKQEIISKYSKSKQDTGSSPVQIALLTSRIDYLQGHFKIHRKDLHSKRGLMSIINKRKKILSHLRNKDLKTYHSTIKSLNLRK